MGDSNNNNNNNNNNNIPAHPGLTPSQAMKGQGKKTAGAPPAASAASSSNGGGGGGGGPTTQPNGNRKRRNRWRNKKPNKGQVAAAQESNNNNTNNSSTADGSNDATSKPPAIVDGTQHSQQGKNGGRQQRKGKPNGQQNQQQQQQNQPNKPQGKNGRNRKSKKRYPWRKFIPPGTVDPITLENLISLPYPPFALVASEPYVPVPVWPVPEGTTTTTSTTTNNQPKKTPEEIEELNRRRIEEQWGKVVVAPGDNGNDGNNNNNNTKKDSKTGDQKVYYNLFDGRALAYYLVSQLQFIDPLNRRDLTRDELLNLDNYLRRHGFKDLRVTEAYDAKGITLSSAGAAATTAQGRADIMQQMARNLLNALFGGNSVEATTAPAAPTPTPAPAMNPLQQQYEMMRRQEEDQARRGTQQQQRSGLYPNAIPYGGFGASDDGGFAIIDDDANPGLRGGDYSATPGSVGRGTFYSAGHIAGMYGSGGTTPVTSPDAFPALPAPPTVTSAETSEDDTAPAGGKPSAKPSKTLSRIAGAVKKTDPEEQQRQWEAREAARKKAMLSRLSFGVEAAAPPQVMDSLPRPPPTSITGAAVPGEGVLQRNKALAEALGVRPATARQQINSGWARPTDGSNLGLDEFGNELTATVYPEALILEAKERMGLLLKLEKKWKSFLLDDAAASMPLNPMDRPARKFVHHYSDFWALRTESFDPEPVRYIHCVKLLDTHMPRPLLSDAARNWRGPVLQLPTHPRSDHASHQTAGQTTKSREISPPRAVLPAESLLQTKELSTAGAGVPPSRFSALATEQRERPKLELAKRTLPLELPPYQPPEPAYDPAEDTKQRQARLEEKERKRREAEEKKRRVLESAFASDDEEEHDAVGAGANDSDSEWEAKAPKYNWSDEE